MRSITSKVIPVACVTLLAFAGACSTSATQTGESVSGPSPQIDETYLTHADDHPGNWVTYGKNYSEDRFSKLDQINKQSVLNLGLYGRSTSGTTRGIETTPLVVDGVMCLTEPWSKVRAVDTRSGKSIWMFDPAVPFTYGEKACCDVVNRGAAFFKGRVYFGTLDGRLIALDATNGKSLWEVPTVDTTKSYTITGAPRIVRGNVIIGNGGADYGVRGYVSAYDAETGKMKWRFYTVPGDPSKPFESKAMEDAAKTWSGEWWKYGGGGTAWDGMAYDPELNLLYIGTGNGSPWNWFHRSKGKGDNLYLSSILALNPDTGELVWHYQTTPGDHWDYTSTQQLTLADVTIDGQPKKVIMQAPKNGFFYVIDRTNGKLLSAAAYTFVNWASSIDKQTGRPIENDFSRYKDKNSVVAPGPIGGHNWQPMAYSPATHLVYIPTHYVSHLYGHDPDWKYRTRGWNTAAEANAKHQTSNGDQAPNNEGQGALIAWDPIAQKLAWKVDHPATYWNGGVVATAGGLVFQGTAEGKFSAYDANSGERLWQTDVGSGVIAAPITYEVDGKQFISLVVGWGGVIGLWNKFTKENYPGTVFTFALDAKGVRPDTVKSLPKSLIGLEDHATADAIKKGGALFSTYCGVCHGWPGANGGAIPNLSYSSEATYNIFEDIVWRGAYLNKGMPNFGDRLTREEVQNIKSYLLYSARLQASNLPSGR